MKSPDSLPQFETDIFPAELNEIANRRANVGLEKPDTTGAPSVEKGLVGLAGPYDFDPLRYRSTRPIFESVASPVNCST